MLAFVVAAAPVVFFIAIQVVPSAAWAQGEPVGPEFRVNTYTTDTQERPDVASDASGNVVVAWQSRNEDGSLYGVFGQRYDSSGAPLGPEFRVNTFTPGAQIRPAVASDASGNFVVVWASFLQDGSEYGVFGQRYDSNANPLGGEFRVNTHTTDSQSSASVASDAGGNFVIVWQSYSYGLLFDVFGQRFANSGAPLGSEFHVTFMPGDQERPEVASSSGNFVVVWESASQDGSGWGVFGQRYAGSGAPLGQFRVNTYTTNDQDWPAVASDSSGNFVIVWQSHVQDGSNFGVFGQRYDSTGAPLGPEFRVNTYATYRQSSPAVASDSSGNFVVVWQSYLQDGSEGGIFGQRFASTGAALGPEFRVNTYTTSYQEYPAVASDRGASGKFVVAWQSNGQDGFDEGVFGQRYSQIVPVELMHFRVE